MSKITVDFELKDSKKSVDAVDASGKRLNKTLERTKELTQGTRGGSKAAAAAFDQTGYNAARGTIGTGASGRDFAKQSRELDGLVRLYSIYAANIFAAGAAFRALSEAMDTTNMVAGLNQLGAASGVAMGGLAKRFAEASGGAISLRESMEATAKAVSSGLSQAQFLKLGDVAKKASQALGVNMSDAVSRLTRGITKLEPELLDELGIFTKVGKATEDYARAIGKPVSALTDFEKRQAFANSVLEEGARKFGQIDIPTNPYDKLLATLRNVAQAGLEIVNNVLGPFANLLSKNTGLLVGILGLIGAKIVKDALPAIGQWRAGLKDAAEQAAKTSSDIAASFGENFVERTNAAFKIPELEANLKKSEEAYRASRAKMAQMDTDLSKRVLKGGAGADEKTLRAEQSRLTREINALKNQGLALDNAQIVALEKQKAAVVALKNDIRALNAAQAGALQQTEGGTIFEKIGDAARMSAAKNARDRATRLGIISDVSRNQKEKGFGPAISQMRDDLKTLPSFFQKVQVGIAGTVVAGAGAIGTGIAGLSRFLGPAAAAIGILQVALPLFRKNEEEAARFSASLDLLKENSENAFRVLERLSKLDPLERLSVDNILAKGTALESLGGSLSKAFDDLDTEIKKRNTADVFTNFLASLIGRSSEQLLAKQVANTVERAVKLSANGPNGKAVQAELANLLKLPANASTLAITDALNAASPAVQAAAGKILQDAGKKAVASAGSFKAFKQGLAESAKVYQDLINTTKNSTPLTKFAEESSTKILELSKVLAGADLPEKLTSLRDLASDINFLQLFPPQAAANILSTANELSKLSEELSEVDRRQSLYNEALNEQQSIIDKDAARNKQQGGKGARISKPQSVLDAEAAVKQLTELNAGLQRTKSSIGTALEASSAKFAESMRTGLIANIDTFSRGLVDAAARGALELKKAASAGFSDPRLKAKIETQTELEGIRLDRKMLEAQMSLINSNSDLRLAIMENTFAQNLEKAGIKGTPEDILSQLNKPENKGLLEERRSLNTFRENRGKSAQELQKLLSTEGLTAGTIAGISESIGQMQAREGVRAQIAALDGKSSGVSTKGRFADVDANRVVALKEIGEIQKTIDQEQAKFAETKSSISEAEFAAANKVFLIRKADADYAAKVATASSELAKSLIADETLKSDLSKQDLEYTQQTYNTVLAQAAVDRELTISTATRTADIAKAVALKTNEIKQTDQAVKLAALQLDTQIGLNQAEQSSLQIKYNAGQLDEDSYKRQLDTLKINEAKLDQTKQLTAAQAAYNQEIQRLDAAKAAAGGFTGEALAADEAERKRLLDFYNAQRDSIKLLTDARIKDAETLAGLTLRQQAYTDLFKQAFKGMEDAIIEFTKTGKLNFKSMIDGFIEGLLRYEIQQQQAMLFKGVGGASGLATSLMGFLGFGSNNSASSILNPTGPAAASVMGFFGAAQGAAYDVGLRKFAKGGMFTNSVVSSPTLFKFAQGTGLMGEAGPEAIMPLKRDSQGNLGVRANNSSAPTVDVVVNNYGNQQATTKETTDSRGNRKIEVMIGDAVAGELSRPGSSVQQSLSGNFGNRPALARR